MYEPIFKKGDRVRHIDGGFTGVVLEDSKPAFNLLPPCHLVLVDFSESGGPPGSNYRHDELERI